MPSDHDFFALYSRYKLELYSGLFTGIAFGAYIIVYITSVYVLLWFLLGMTTFMFALGILALVLRTMLVIMETRAIFDTSLPDTLAWICYYGWEACTCLMYILCDIICAWRTVVIWKQDKRVIAILVFSIVGTTGAAGYAVVFGYIPDAYPADWTSLSWTVIDFVVFGPTLGTNLLSTGLIAWKAWQHRIQVGNHLREGTGSVRIERVLALLMESGLIYCFIWILYGISMFGVLPSPGNTLIAFVAGLYPTLIIILISKQMSPVENYSIHSTDMRFTRMPTLGPPRSGSTAGMP